MIFTLYWENYFKAANEKVNPPSDPTSNKVTLCKGYAVVNAENAIEARQLWERTFPTDRVIKIS